MVVAVVGSRTFTDYEYMKEKLSGFSPDTIISGGAKGADSLAIKYAKEHNIPYKEYKPDWQDFSEPCIKKKGKYGPYNALAGHKRNSTLVGLADLVIAFWDGQSKGTKDTINKCINTKTMYIVYDY